jgi:restriction system protein
MAQAPVFTQMLWPTIEALKQLGGSAANDELPTNVIDTMQLSPEVQNVPHTDGRQSKVSYNLHWAKTYLKKAGYVDNSTRGVWALTDAGEICTQSDVSKVPALVRKMAAEARRSRQVPGRNLLST